MTKQRCFPIFVMILILGLSACTGGTKNVSLKQSKAFPIPLVEAYPLNLGSFYAPEFIDYTYSIQAKRTSRGVTKVISTTNVQLGEPQINMFNSVLNGMFNSVTPVTSVNVGEIPAQLDAVLVPTVIDFQYANPRVTRQNVYEVWIKYRIRLLAPDGTKIADFTIPAYGKTPSALLKTEAAAINSAAIVALRDVGASLITRFEREPDVNAWLAGKNLLLHSKEEK